MKNLLAVPAEKHCLAAGGNRGLVLQGHRGNPLPSPGDDRPVVADLRDRDDRLLPVLPLEDALAVQDQAANLVNPVGQEDYSAAALADVIQCSLDRPGVVRHAVALGLEFPSGIGDASPVEVVGPRDLQGQCQRVGWRLSHLDHRIADRIRKLAMIVQSYPVHAELGWNGC